MNELELGSLFFLSETIAKDHVLDAVNLFEWGNENCLFYTVLQPKLANRTTLFDLKSSAKVPPPSF